MLQNGEAWITTRSMVFAPALDMVPTRPRYFGSGALAKVSSNLGTGGSAPVDEPAASCWATIARTSASRSLIVGCAAHARVGRRAARASEAATWIGLISVDFRVSMIELQRV